MEVALDGRGAVHVVPYKGNAGPPSRSRDGGRSAVVAMPRGRSEAGSLAKKLIPVSLRLTSFQVTQRVSLEV